ncbi:hypothetical protein DERP_005132 [Dermatophagoides pteronyssinus]|uniref:Uncharacterized protein n=1 Tax=Dermatophagoides pteronyssinus TaxID=6956 RepID=A0ABQ8JU35_DERPT|nr:hypothetical protein DERP_005132 [Dermatophagoides pteronyssinus]
MLVSDKVNNLELTFKIPAEFVIVKFCGKLACCCAPVADLAIVTALLTVREFARAFVRFGGFCDTFVVVVFDFDTKATDVRLPAVFALIAVCSILRLFCWFPFCSMITCCTPLVAAVVVVVDNDRFNIVIPESLIFLTILADLDVFVGFNMVIPSHNFELFEIFACNERFIALLNVISSFDNDVVIVVLDLFLGLRSRRSFIPRSRLYSLNNSSNGFDRPDTLRRNEII